MEVSGVIKKIKDTKFAAGVSREHVRYCEKVLNIRLEDFIQDMIQALLSTL
jgi:predicted hydrolase (HD superfamily)